MFLEMTGSTPISGTHHHAKTDIVEMSICINVVE